MGISTLISDAGKGKAAPWETNDCGVKALAVVCGLQYARAHELARLAGRKDRTGWNVSPGKFQSLGLGLEPRLPPFPLTLAQWVRLHPKGRYIVVTRDHGTAVIDGFVVDEFPARARTRVRFAMEATR